MGSVAGKFGFPTSTAYCASKFALNGLTQALYHELAEEGIHVTIINPGIVASEIGQVDNKGKFHEKAKDPRPSFLIMPTDKAARQMVRAIAKKKAEVIITKHGKIIVWLNNHCSGLLRRFIRYKTKGKMKTIKENRRGTAN
jgi:short-subunit dehydrogenase